MTVTAPERLLQRLGAPMLALLQEDAEGLGEGPWVFELKYDGFRALGARSGDRTLLNSRNGNNLGERFPEVLEAVGHLAAREVVVDGEIIANDASGRSDFSRLSQVGERHYVVFDLLWLEGEDLRALPLETRREKLAALVKKTRAKRISLSERLEGPASHALATAAARHAEGVVCKRAESLYQSTRSADWQKLKTRGNQELALVGFTRSSTGLPEIGALLLGVREKDGYRYAGKVGTGFDSATRRKLYRLLSADRVETPSARGGERGLAAARWVRPKYVGQIAFTEWTADGRLRHPSFQGLRDDKRPEDTHREQVADQPASVRAKVKRAMKRASPAARTLRAPTASAAGKPAAPRVTLTHPDRVVFPSPPSKPALTKADVFAYYQHVAPAMLPVLRGRPLTLEQFPKGTGAQGFFRQNLTGVPSWVTTVKVAHEVRPVNHVVADDADALAWLVNQNALTFHGWNSHAPDLETPDWVAFDFDPGEGRFSDVVKLVLALRGLLEQLELQGFPKTSGKRGLHVLVPAQGLTHASATEFAVQVTQTLARGFPDLATTERSIAKRGGRHYLDAHQNGRGKTVCLPYSLRAAPNAQASTPLQWSEVVAKLDPTRFTLHTVPARVEKLGDLFKGLFEVRQRLPQVRDLNLPAPRKAGPRGARDRAGAQGQ